MTGVSTIKSAGVCLLGLATIGCAPRAVDYRREWDGLKTGMNKTEVERCVGQPLKPIGMSAGIAKVLWHGVPILGGIGPAPDVCESWIYGYYDLLDSRQGPGDKGRYQVDFDQEGRVSFWRPYCVLRASDASSFGSDSLESIFVREDGEVDQSLAPPTLVEPAERRVFDHYPRELTLWWSAAAGTPAGAEYLVQTDFMTGHAKRFDGARWAGPMTTERTGKTSFRTSHPGAQPGRWRVKLIVGTREGEWSEWRYFRFTR